MNTPLRVAARAGRDTAAAALDAELRQLADQLQRCGGHGPLSRMRRLAERMRSFTSRHATSVTAAIALTAAIVGLVS
jgi:hypothetical protein